MIIGGVLVIGLAVDTLAVTSSAARPRPDCRRSLLYSVAAGLSNSGYDWPWFLPAAAGYLPCCCPRCAGTGSPSGGGSSAGTGAPPRVRPPPGRFAPVRTGRCEDRRGRKHKARRPAAAAHDLGRPAGGRRDRCGRARAPGAAARSPRLGPLVPA
ncbi:hypothetical protein ACRAWF_22610, partial [Streptomyces sp. L7]